MDDTPDPRDQWTQREQSPQPSAPGQVIDQAPGQPRAASSADATGSPRTPTLYLVPDHRSPAQRLWARMNQVGARGVAFLPMLGQVIVPGAPVHLGSDQQANIGVLDYHAESISGMFPDLEIEVERVIEAGEYLVMLLDMYGHTGPDNPIMVAGQRLKMKAALLARADAEGRMAELWTYVYPGGAFSFPARGVAAPPPVAQPGAPEQARQCYEALTARLAAGDPFEVALGCLLRPDGIVHLPNGDAGSAAVLHELFKRYRAGLPDFSVQLTFALVHESWLVMRFSARGTHTGVLGIYPPTGRVLPSHGLVVVRVDQDAAAAELWFHAGPAYALGFPDAGPDA